MIPEIGHFSLILALCFALLQSVTYGLATLLHTPILFGRTPRFAYAQFIFILISFIALTISFIENDFSVLYVASHSNSLLPLMYRISAVWGGHEGSLLLWMLFLSGWGLCFTLRARTTLPSHFYETVLSVLGALSAIFICFILLTSNPFARLLPLYPLEGQDLNPLLQDPLLVIHPPFFISGLCGFCYCICGCDCVVTHYAQSQ